MESEDVTRERKPLRLRKLRYAGDLTEAFNARPADQPFGESGTGWPYRVLSVAVEPVAQVAGGGAITVVTLEPYPVDAYGDYLERQRAAWLAKRGGKT